MNARIHAAVAAMVALFGACEAPAKGSTVQVTITGPGLTMPVHTSTKAATSANVWFGNYVDWEAGALQAAEDESLDYQVYFWVSFPEEPAEMKYMVRYRWDDALGRAIICLPGERDPWFSVNVFSIVRGNEGSCFCANREWGDAIKTAIVNAQ